MIQAPRDRAPAPIAWTMIQEKEGNTMKEHISLGNAKVDDIPSFSLPPIKSCGELACQTCGRSEDGHRPSCYACKAYAMYPSARDAWDENMKYAQNDLPGLEKSILIRLPKLQKRNTKRHPGDPLWFRGHVSGDLEPVPGSTEYAHMWCRVCRMVPRMVWFTYSKSLPVLDRFLSEINLDLPANMVIQVSDWPGLNVRSIIWEKYPHIKTMIQAGRIHIAYVDDHIPEHTWYIPQKAFRCRGTGKAGDKHTCRNCTQKGPWCALGLGDTVFEKH